jgi:hypothetical protein
MDASPIAIETGNLDAGVGFMTDPGTLPGISALNREVKSFLVDDLDTSSARKRTCPKEDLTVAPKRHQISWKIEGEALFVSSGSSASTLEPGR